MSRSETVTVVCDVCGRVFGQTEHTGPDRFLSHSAADSELKRGGWYYDKWTDRCPEHWPGMEEDDG